MITENKTLDRELAPLKAIKNAYPNTHITQPASKGAGFENKHSGVILRVALNHGQSVLNIRCSGSILSEPVALPPRNNQHIIDFVRGASASALLYSSAKSAKANQLKPFEYFTYLLKELLKYPRENIPEEELKKLMSWSEALRIAAGRIKPDKKNLPA